MELLACLLTFPQSLRSVFFFFFISLLKTLLPPSGPVNSAWALFFNLIKRCFFFNKTWNYEETDVSNNKQQGYRNQLCIISRICTAAHHQGGMENTPLAVISGAHFLNNLILLCQKPRRSENRCFVFEIKRSGACLRHLTHLPHPETNAETWSAARSQQWAPLSVRRCHHVLVWDVNEYLVCWAQRLQSHADDHRSRRSPLGAAAKERERGWIAFQAADDSFFGAESSQCWNLSLRQDGSAYINLNY